MSTPDSFTTHLMRWQKAVAGRIKWTHEAWIDRLVASNKSWSPDDLESLWVQNRDPSNYPILHTVRESVCGLEAQTRRDTTVLARISAHADTATALSGINKYIDQQNKASYVRSKAFRSAVDVGVGWTEVFYSDDPHAEPIGKRNVDAMHIWMDPTGREDDLSDYQDMFRARWLPRHWVDMRFNTQTSVLSQMAPVFNYDPLSHTQNYRDKYGDEPPVSRFNQGMGGDPNFGPGHGLRAPNVGQGWATQDGDNWWRTNRYEDLCLVVERWYRADEWANFVIMADGRVITVTDQNARQCAQILLAGQGRHKLRHAIDRKMRCAIFIADGQGGLLQDVPSPYPHGQFPFIPTWGYRDEEGQPMGIVRLLRDAAREYNMRRTHLTMRSMMTQVHAEEGTFVDDAQALLAIKKYNGHVRYNLGMLDKAKIRSNADMSPGATQLEMNLLSGALGMVQNLGPMNQEALGQETGADSGVAIENRQQQAHVALSYLFDMRNLAQQCEGEQTIDLIQDSYTEEKEIRINGTSAGLQYLKVNSRDPKTGVLTNNLGQGRYDYIVEEQPEAPTIRAAKIQQIGQVFQGVDLPPADRIGVAIFMAEAQDLPADVIGLLKDAQKRASEPQPPQQPAVQQRKTIQDILRIDFATLVPEVQAQIMTGLGVQVRPGMPVTVQPEPDGQAPAQVTPDAALKSQTALAVQQSKNQHAATQAEAERHHDHTTLAATLAHEHTGRLMSASETANARADAMVQSHHERQAAEAHAKFHAVADQMTQGTQAGLNELAAQNQHLRDAGLIAQQHQNGLEMASQQPRTNPEPSPKAGVSS